VALRRSDSGGPSISSGRDKTLKLLRTLGFWDVFAIAAGAMISSGLFVLPGLAFKQAGPAVILAYALAGVMVIPAMLSQAELSSAMPRSGGSYFFIERSLGALPGTLAGLANWLSIALKSAFALIGIGAFARLIYPDAGDWTIKGIALGACAVFTGLNLLSVKGTGRFQIVMVGVLLAILAVFLVADIPEVSNTRMDNFLAKGMGNVLATAGLVFISFGGLTKVASVAGEVHKPGRNIPAGMFAACLVVTLLYVATVFVVVGTLDAQELSGNLTPVSISAWRGPLGRTGEVILSIGAMLAFFTTANSGILSASRSPMAMSRDGLLPDVMQKLSRRFNTPWVSILATSAFIVVVITALSIENLVKVASTMMLMLFLMVNVAVLIMRGSRIQNYRPMFRSPLCPWMQIAGIIVYGFLITRMGAVPLLTTAAFVLVGIAWYFVYARAKTGRESALVYMVRRIVAKDLSRAGLEEELKQIAFERDDVTHDRFDELIRNCAVLDLPTSTSAEEMFSQAAGILAERLPTSESDLLELFRQREAQSSTVVRPGLAIPHIIIQGEKLFDVLLVRAREGIDFPGQDEPVKVGFVLIGTPDERNYHLRALMAIAHIADERDFMRRWLAAGESQHLRDVVLLSERKRDM